MDTESPAPLERSVSSVSQASVRSSRGHTVRAKSRNRKLVSQPSSSASSIAASDKSLTSFPSFSPESPRAHRANNANPSDESPGADHQRSEAQTPPSIVATLTSFDEPQKTARNALFEDTPLTTRKVPGALHLADDSHIERLITRHGAVGLVRQIAEDLAHRDTQVATLRQRADERERALRKIILECGLSNLDLETRLRAIETEARANGELKRSKLGGLSDLMNDAMEDNLAYSDYYGFDDPNQATIRAGNTSIPKEDTAKGTMKGWKDYIWGYGTSKKNSRTNSMSEEQPKTGVRDRSVGDRRPTLQDDLFNPPDENSIRSSSRASSSYGTSNARKPSASLASLALRLVAGSQPASRDTDSSRGRSSSAGQAATLRTPSSTSARTASSTRAASAQVGPKALMAMRRAAPAAVNVPAGKQPSDRWDTMGVSPQSPLAGRSDNLGPVELDTIFSPENQPPTLTHIYNNYVGSEYLTDRFGFIYDQRRKKRQREAAQVARKLKQGGRTEMLSSGRSGLSPTLVEDDASVTQSIGSDDRPASLKSNEEISDQGRPKRWQDYLKIATFPTELLSHTPSMSASALEVMEGTETPETETPRSPGLITSDDRGFLPPASTTAALDSETGKKPGEESPNATLVKEDAEPVRLLLHQLSDVHDSLQREKTVRWTEFLRKVRAEKRKEGEAAEARAAAAAEARFQRAPVMIPEAKMADGEMIGIADLGVKGRVGRAKWNEFKGLILGGIPVSLRPKVWSECSGAISLRIPGYYDDIVSRSTEDDDPIVVSQIKMDINRTLTDNIFFRKGPGVSKLNEVLLAYARRNPEVGYCQGMNLITANLLLIMPSSEDAFWILTSIIENILPRGYYDHSLLSSRADQQVLRQYVTQVLPKLSQHLEELSIELEALTFQWFLSVFTDCLSAEALFRVWDVVLSTNDGSTFLFQVALALLKLNEQQLLQCNTPAAVYTYINHQMTNHAISIDGLIHGSEGLRKVIRREDVEAMRNRAIEAEKELIREREELNRARKSQPKTLTAPALVTEETASAKPSPRPSPLSGPSSLAGDDIESEELSIRTPMPMEEEAHMSLG